LTYRNLYTGLKDTIEIVYKDEIMWNITSWYCLTILLIASIDSTQSELPKCRKSVRSNKEFRRNFAESCIGEENCEITEDDKQFFKDWAEQTHKTFNSFDEEKESMRNLLTTKQITDEHNAMYEMKLTTFRSGLWRLSDLTSDEKDEFLLGTTVPMSARSDALDIDFPSGPDSIDWVEAGLVGPVMSQGWPK